MESSLANLKQEVHCSLCNDTLLEPKILQCFHTFCKLCIKRHADLIDQANVFKCPKCSSETSLQDLSSVDNLKPSLFHSRILKVLEFVESEKVCSVSGSHSTASWHCPDCNRSLCDECYNNHSIFTQNHKVVFLTEPKNEDIKILLSRESKCVYHTDKTQEFFCNDCEQVICVECLKQDHDGHSTVLLVKYTSTKKALLYEQLEHVKRREKEIQNQVEIIEETTSRLKSSCEKAKQDVRETLQKIIDVLEGKSVELLRQIDEIIEKAEKRKAKGQCVLDQTRSAIEYMNKLIEKGLPNELMEKKDVEIYNKLIRLDEDDSSNSKASFVCNDELMMQVESGLGSILQANQTDSSMSIVEVDSEIEAQKKAKLIVTTKTSTKQLNNDPSDVVDVKITPEDDVEVEEKYMRSSVGKIEIEFMPKVPGQLSAEVKVNGNPVPNSPIVMNVKPKEMGILNELKMKGVGNLEWLSGIAVNKGNSKIAVADLFSNCVHVFNTDGDLLMTHNSRTFGEDFSPMDLVFVNETDLLILEAKQSSKRICKVRTTTNTLIETLTLVGKDSGIWIYPGAVHVDDDGNIIVTNRSFLNRKNDFVEVFTKEGNHQYQFGLSEQDNFYPVSTVTHRGLFYVSDYNNHVIHVFEKKGNVPTRISTIGGQGSADGQLSTPRVLAIDNDHNLLVCDTGNKRIQKFTLDGRFVGKTCDEIKNLLYIAVLKNGQLLVISGTTVFYVG